MNKYFLLLTLVVTFCINSAVFAQSDWDAMWQSNDWQGLSGGSEYNTSQNSQQNNTSQQNNIDKQCKESNTGVIYTKDAIIYCPGEPQDLGRWKSW